jgi:hypothetical protein
MVKGYPWQECPVRTMNSDSTPSIWALPTVGLAIGMGMTTKSLLSASAGGYLHHFSHHLFAPQDLLLNRCQLVFDPPSRMRSGA